LEAISETKEALSMFPSGHFTRINDLVGISDGTAKLMIFPAELIVNKFHKVVSLT
jgi:hypothetical protein